MKKMILIYPENNDLDFKNIVLWKDVFKSKCVKIGLFKNKGMKAGKTVKILGTKGRNKYIKYGIHKGYVSNYFLEELNGK